MVPSGYVKIAIENGHRNSGFSHWKWWFSIVMLVYQRVTMLLWMWVVMLRPQFTGRNFGCSKWWKHVKTSTVPAGNIGEIHGEIVQQRPWRPKDVPLAVLVRNPVIVMGFSQESWQHTQPRCFLWLWLKSPWLDTPMLYQWSCNE